MYSDEGEEEHSIFALPTHYDRRLLTWLIVALIGVTVIYEKITEYLEENVFNEGIRAKLWSKILRELTILGFVSFSATITLQAVHLPEDDHLIFEYAHVLMFTLAIMYSKEIAISSILFSGIQKGFVAQDAEADEDLLAGEREWAEAVGPLRGLSRTCARSHLLNSKLSKRASSSQFKVLRFHFMARSGLLGKARFEWAAYVIRSMEHHLEEMLEVQMSTWLALLALVALSVPIDLTPLHAVYAFAASGWAVLLLSFIVLQLSDGVLTRLVAHGHVLRIKAKHLAKTVTEGNSEGSSLHGGGGANGNGGGIGKQATTNGLSRQHAIELADLERSVKAQLARSTCAHDVRRGATRR